MVLEYDLKFLRKASEEIPLNELGRKAQEIYTQLRNAYINLGGGAGLAAPQIGIYKRVFIWSPDRKLESLKVAINPIVYYKTSNIIPSTEGCYSIPQKLYEVDRLQEIYMEYYDENFKFKSKTFFDFEAIVIQHEYDHLNGCLICDKGSLKKQFNTIECYNNYIRELRK